MYSKLGTMLASIAGIGFVYLLLASAGVAGLSRLSDSIPRWSGGSMTLSILLAAGWALTGVGLIYRGSLLKRPVDVPPRAPGAFNREHEIYNAYTSRELPAYKLAAPLVRYVKRIFGDSGAYGTASTQRAIQTVLSTLKSTGWIFALGFLFMFFLFLGLQRFVFVISAIAATGLVVAWLGYQTWQMVQWTKKYYGTIHPEVDADEHLVTLQGAGDPFLLASKLEAGLTELRVNRIPNRIQKYGWEQANKSVGDAGTFAASMIVENQPVPAKQNIDMGAGSLLHAAKFSLLAAAALSLVVPPNAGILVHLTWLILPAGLVVMFTGFAKAADQLLRSFRWNSIGLAVAVEGTVGRSEIRAGRAVSDSFESANTVVRSDCHVRIYGAEMTSESVGINGARDLLACQPTEFSRQATQLCLRIIQDFESEGVRIRGVDLASQAVSSTTEANLLTHQAKQGSMAPSQTAEEVSRLGPVNDNQPEQIEAPAENGEAEPAPWPSAKVQKYQCPNCSGVVEAQAGQTPVCGECGYR